MQWMGPRPISLKARVMLLTLLTFGLGLMATGYYASRVMRLDTQELVGSQQMSTVSVLAARAQADVQDRLKALETLGAALGAGGLQDVAGVQAALDQDRLGAHLFNEGVFVTGPDGVALASSPASLGRVGTRYRDRDCIAAALDGGPASVGRPVARQPRGEPPGQPVLMMAAPVRDAQGRVLGAVAGVTHLGLPNFLQQITQHPYGETGGYFVVSRAHRLVVTASDPQRAMESLPPPGVNPVIDRLMQGFEGSVVLVNQHGTEVLNSGRHVPAAGWDVVASIPTQEAYAPARAAQQRMLQAAAPLTVLLGGLLWWLLRQQLAPTVAAARALGEQARGAQPPQPLPVARADEVGTLIAAFNALLITLKQREADLRVSDLALKSISEAVVLTGPDAAVLSANQAHEAITGYTEQELRGHNLRLLQGADTNPSSVAALHQAVAEQRSFTGELLNYRKDGTPFWNDLMVTPVHDDQGRLTHFVGITRDVTQRRRAEEEINRLAFYDTLTQLPNRRLLNDRLEQALAGSKRSGLHGAVIFIDLDGFKLLNDRHGHGVGDLLLVQVADRLRGCVREADTVARFGGDEFVVMLTALTADAAASAELAGAIAEKLRQALAEPYTLPTVAGRSDVPEHTGTVQHRCSASIGVALFNAGHQNIDELLRLADVAMYAAKRAGRDTVRFHQPPV